MGAILDELRHAFAVEPETRITGGELPASLERIAEAVVSRGMETPAIVFLEAATPLSFLGSQAMFALWPFVKLASIEADYREVARALEDRRSLRMLATRIEELAVTNRVSR
ncbi:MAG: hypothetical protein JRF63_04305 [Deltaproteobacteria bacterium]|nr:hypothetical protein [Deltaproteobacteria bacterium]